LTNVEKIKELRMKKLIIGAGVYLGLYTCVACAVLPEISVLVHKEKDPHWEKPAVLVRERHIGKDAKGGSCPVNNAQFVALRKRLQDMNAMGDLQVVIESTPPAAEKYEKDRSNEWFWQRFFRHRRHAQDMQEFYAWVQQSAYGDHSCKTYICFDGKNSFPARGNQTILNNI
jgi:hypothetical protein